MSYLTLNEVIHKFINEEEKNILIK